MLEVCAEKLGFTSLDHMAAAGAVSLSIWYDGSLVYRVARALHELGLDLPLLRAEAAVQLWYEIARDDRRDAAPFHPLDRALTAIPAHRLEEAGDRIPWPIEGRHFFDTDEIRMHPPGIVRGVPT